jgi:hypothetical protein
MITPGKLDLVVQRWTPFDYSIQMPLGLDFTDAVATLQARLRPDAPGDPIISLVIASSAGQGLSWTHVTDDDELVTSTLRIRINETTAEAILLNAGRAPTVDKREDVRLSHDIHITGGGLAKTRWFEGVLTIRGGSNHA